MSDLDTLIKWNNDLLLIKSKTCNFFLLVVGYIQD